METTRTIGEMLADLRKLQDSKDELNAAMKEVNQGIEAVEIGLMHALKDSGQTKAADDFISVTLGTKWRAKYEPKKWVDIVKSLVASGHEYLIQRRLTDAKVMELIDNGTPLPDGLSVEAFPDLSFRRTR